MISPILLNDIAVLTPNAVRELADTTRFQNPFNTAMLLDEIRFRVVAAPTLSGSEQPPDAPTHGSAGDAAWAVHADIRLGRNQFTNGFVPIGNLARVFLESHAQMWHTWKLPRAVYVPPGELVITRLFLDERFLTVADTQITMEVVYAGRSMPADYPPPEKIYLPWASFYRTPFADPTDGGIIEDVSKEPDLVNPFNEPLFVQRMIGRGIVIQPGATPPNTGPLEYGQIFNRDSIFSRYMNVRAADYAGNILVRDPTPFSHIFNKNDRSWSVNTVLPPKGFYLFHVEQNYETAAFGEVPFLVAGSISLVGHREVALR